MSVSAAEILVTIEGIDEVKMTADAYRELLKMEINTQICVDSKDVFTASSTQRNYIDRSMRSDVACISFEFQVVTIHQITRGPGKLNLTDALTNPGSS